MAIWDLFDSDKNVERDEMGNAKKKMGNDLLGINDEKEAVRKTCVF